MKDNHSWKYVVLQYTKEAGTFKNKPTGQKSSLKLDSTTSSGCVVPNRKLLPQIIH